MAEDPKNDFELTELMEQPSDFQYCDQCGGRLCQHGICSDNWCAHDERCQECADREWREIEAEDEAKYWSHPGWKEVFGEDQ